MRRTLRLPLVALPLIASCAEAPVGVQAAAPRASTSATSPKFLACPGSSSALSGSATIGVEGGVIKAGPLRLEVPAGAVTAPTAFVAVVPSSPYLEVDLRAGSTEHFVFERPVTVTLDLQRCGGVTTGPDGSPLRAVYVAPVTREVLEDMGGTVDPGTRTLRFRTGHFSSYVVAY